MIMESNGIKRLLEYILMLCFAGYLYVCLEILFRGFSDVSMLFAASICAIPMIALNNVYSFELDYFVQVMLCGVFCTCVEYMIGRYLVNQQYQLWDYREMPFNVHGQVCLVFSLVWIVISAVMIPIFDYIDYYVFDGDKPYYRLFGWYFG